MAVARRAGIEALRDRRDARRRRLVQRIRRDAERARPLRSPVEELLDHRDPSGGGVVRNMVAFGDKLYLAESGVNKVAVAQVRR